MKAIKVVDDPEKFKLLADDTRRRIVFLLRAKEMTVSQIASTLEVTPQAIYHHIKKLQKADLVKVTRE
jgi:DNA-binding transcriptional ArsR family regulator